MGHGEALGEAPLHTADSSHYQDGDARADFLSALRESLHMAAANHSSDQHAEHAAHEGHHGTAGGANLLEAHLDFYVNPKTGQIMNR